MGNSINSRLVELEIIVRGLGYRADVLHVAPFGKSFFVVRERDSESGIYAPKEYLSDVDNEVFKTWVLQSFEEGRAQVVNSVVIERECRESQEQQRKLFK